jgi:hypothetical protein
MSDIPQFSPETEKKRREHKELASRLHALLAEWHHLNTIVKPALLARYDALFRSLEIDIQKKSLLATELNRRVELLMMKQQRGEKLTPALIALVHKIVDKEYEGIRSRMREAFDMSKQEREEAARKKFGGGEFHQGGLAAQKEMPRMYRALVKKLHPDSSRDPDLTNKYWHSVQQAYEQKNAAGIQSFYSLLIEPELMSDQQDPPSAPDNSTLDKQIEIFRQNIAAEQKKINRLKEQAPFIYELGLRDDQWVQNHQKNLENEIKKREQEIRKSQDLLRMLTGSEWQDQKIPDTDIPETMKQQEQEQEDFMMNTYFSGKH